MKKISLFLFFINYAYAVTVVDSIDFTLKNNEKLKIYETDLKISKKGIIKKDSRFYPELNLYLNKKETRGTIDDIKDARSDKRGKLDAKLNLFNGFTDIANHDAAKDDIRSKESLLTYWKDRLSLESIKAHLNIVYKNRLYNIELENISQDRELLKISESISDVIGDITPTIEVKTDLDYAKSAANEAYKRIGESLFEYKMLTGMSFKADEFSWPMIDEGLLSDVESKITTKNSLIKNYNYQIDKLQDEIRAKKGSYYPKVDLVGEYNKYTINGKNELDDDRTLKLELRYNIFNGFYNKAEIEQKKLQKMRTVYEKQYSIKEIIKDTKTVEYTTDVYKKLIKQDKKTLKSLLKLRGLYIKQFSVGKRQINDIIDLQKKIVSIKKDLVLNQFSVKLNYFYTLSYTGELLEFVKKKDIFKSEDKLNNTNITYTIGSKTKKKVQSAKSLKDRYSVFLGSFIDKKEAKKILRKYNPYTYLLENEKDGYSVYYGSFKYKKSAEAFSKKYNDTKDIIQLKEIISVINLPKNATTKKSLLSLNP